MDEITVMGATGRTGGEVARRLLGAGHRVRALGRSAAGLEALRARGADVLAGDVTDEGYLTEAFAGAAGAYVLLPHDPTWEDFHARSDRLGAAIAGAVGEVPHVAALSSLGAEVPLGTGLLASLHAQERRLQAAGVPNLLLLRAGMFFESALAQLDVVAAHGVAADALPGDLAVPWVASRDVAAVAADALDRRAWDGLVVREVHGPAALTYDEVAAALGARIGRPDLTYVRLGDDDVAGALVAAGASPDMARQHLGMCRALEDGVVRGGLEPVVRAEAPTTFTAYVQELALERVAG